MKHTPTPWEAYQYDFEVYRHEFCGVMSHDGEAVAEYATKADAEFICRAANNHDALVDALEVYHSMFELLKPLHTNEMLETARFMADIALKQARGE